MKPFPNQFNPNIRWEWQKIIFFLTICPEIEVFKLNLRPKYGSSLVESGLIRLSKNSQIKGIDLLAKI